MAFKTKTELKDVFNGLSSLYFCKTAVDLDGASDAGGNAISIDWDFDLPVTVDTLQISQDDPTINHYKVIGLQGDWTSSAEAGDFTVQFTVPTKAEDVIKLAFGETAYKTITGATMTGGDAPAGAGKKWEGSSVVVNMQKVTGTIGLLDENKENFMIITNIALYAKPLYENASTEPFAIQFSGSIETSGDANFAWLKRVDAD